MPSDALPFDYDEPEAPPFDFPEGIRPRAFEAFDEMIRDCGATIHRMPSSCEMYLRQYLLRYGKERDLLIAALRQGVPDQVILNSKKDGYAEYLAAAAGRLAGETGAEVPHAKWAVEAWATVLGRPPGYRPGPVVARPVAPPPGFEESQKPAVSERGLRFIMAAIAAAGGFVGGALGNGGAFLVLVITGMALDAQFDHKAPGAGQYALLVIVLVMMIMGGLGAGLGAFGGWLFGRGDARPWAGFSAACGAAFGTSCVLFFCIGPGFVNTCAMCVSAFGAAFTAASRGGYRS